RRARGVGHTARVDRPRAPGRADGRSIHPPRRRRHRATFLGGPMRFVLLGLLIAGCTGDPPPPVPTQARCPDPDPGTLTWDNFGQPFMAQFCTSCQDSALPHSQRNGAPLYHDYNTLLGVMEIPDHIDQWAGDGPAADNT